MAWELALSCLKALPDLKKPTSKEACAEEVILALLAHTGISTSSELRMLAGAFLCASPDSGTVKRAVNNLRECKLIITDTLRLTGPAPIMVIRLSEQGLIYCSHMGYPLVTSEWEILIEEHNGEIWTQHTAAVLYFLFQVRLRGYSTRILPNIPGCKIAPDVKITSADGERFQYVEVEIRARRKLHKWRQSYRKFGFISICTITPAQRVAIVKECHEAGVRRGFATDIETLIQASKGEDSGPLWITKW